jgi:acetyltransferase-like isoleucine patch superfamily enzyme
MQAKSAEKPKSLMGKAWWVLAHRPREFFGSLRGYFLFERTRFLKILFPLDPAQIELGVGVRLQKLGCLRAEKPGAKIRIGNHSIVYENAEISAYGNGTIQIGDCAVLGDLKIVSRYQIKIGRRFLSSWNVFIQDFDPHPISAEDRARQVEAICGSFRPRYAPHSFQENFDWSPPGEAIEIGDDVWIGANSTLLKGVKIGNGCIVATGSVVVGGTFPDGSLIAGNPAKLVKAL